MRRSSIFLLLGAVMLGLLAVFAARMFLVPDKKDAKSDVPVVTAVVALKPFKFGDKITADKLKTIPWPGTLPANAYKSPRDAVGDGSRAALREIGANELLLSTSISGEAGRLSSSTLLGPEMRAVAVPINETAGAGGFLAPGDRVDVLLSRSIDEDNAFASAIVQGARVLAVGQSADTSKSEPVVVKSATIEVTPAEAQRIALGQTIGTITLALRGMGDEARTPVAVVSAYEMFPGARRISTKASADSAPAAASGPAVPRAPAAPMGPQVSVVRGTETTSYQVPR